MKYILIFSLLIASPAFRSQNMYFPPLTGTVWSTTDPISLGWCQENIDSLYTYLDETHSKAFLLLQDGKIVLEKYFGTFTQDSLWVWNSAGKTLTAMAVGIAQQENLLSISDTTSDYLGTGWTSLSPQQEEKITIRHQLTMTSGLGYIGDWYCTDPNCLIYIADPGTRWSYHNAPYTLLDGVIETASGMTMNNFVSQKIASQIGMNGLYIPVGYNNIYVSTGRGMARYGLLLLNQGNWDGNQILTDPGYFQEMTNSSQSFNPSYGYLTWLNGKGSYMLPSPDVQITINEDALPNAPADVFAAIGKNGQIINVSPSQNLVMIRMGDNDGNSLVSNQYNDTIWQKINLLPCQGSVSKISELSEKMYPNPVKQQLIVPELSETSTFRIIDVRGLLMDCPQNQTQVDVSSLSPGVYFLELKSSHKTVFRQFIKE